MSRSRSYQRSRRDGAERYHNGQLMRRQYADVDHYAAYVASAGPARAPAVEREALDTMLAAQAPGYSQRTPTRRTGGVLLEVPAGFEPANGGFADHCHCANAQQPRGFSDEE